MQRWIACLLACACGPSGTEVATFGELCGTQGPVRVLEFDPEERLYMTSTSALPVGDRLLFGVIDLEPDPSDEASAERVYATGLCGESPGVVAQDVSTIQQWPQYPGVALGCADGTDGDVVLIDPHGLVAPRTVFTAPGCRGVRGKHGIVGMRDDALVFQAFPPDLDGPPVAPVVLLPTTLGFTNTSFALLDDAVFTIDGSGNLVRVALPSGDVTVLQSGVSTFDVSRDGRTIAYVADSTWASDEWTVGEVVVRDRVTGESIAVSGALFNSPAPDDDGLLTLWADVDYQRPARVVDLATQSVHELPDDRIPLARISDGRLLTRSTQPGEFQLRELSTGVETALPRFVVAGEAVSWPYSVEADGVFAGSLPDGPLLRLPYDGSSAELLAKRHGLVNPTLADGRIVTLLGVTHERGTRGTLVVVDPETLDEQIVDVDVTPHHVFVGDELGDGGDMVAYRVDDGDRSGIWLARLPSE